MTSLHMICGLGRFPLQSKILAKPITNADIFAVQKYKYHCGSSVFYVFSTKLNFRTQIVIIYN